jgi:hypothetical protein
MVVCRMADSSQEKDKAWSGQVLVQGQIRPGLGRWDIATPFERRSGDHVPA